MKPITALLQTITRPVSTVIFLCFLLGSRFFYAQYVPISDANFRQFIQSTYPALLNTSLELDTVEAATITGTLNCRNKNIVTMDEVKYFKSVSRIYAMNNKLVSFPYLRGFNNLTYIVLDSNQLTSIPEVNHITTLEELKCNYNQLTALPNLSGLTNLWYLKCSYNRITVLPDLTGLNSLKMLYCENNLLTELPALAGFSQMLEVKCGFNQLTQLPNLSDMVLLKKLYCQNNQLSSIPSLTALTALEELILDYNQLTSIPSLTGITTLKRLLCEHNRLAELPSLSGLAALRELKVGSNQLTSIPSLTDLSSMVFFYCDDNDLVSLPSLTNCTKLDKLICSRNKITALPDLSTLNLLKRIFCEHNLLTTFPSVNGLSSLQGLFIGHNQLTSLPPLYACPLLTELQVDSNQLTSLPNLSFMNNVIRVDVRYNNLSFEDLIPLASHPDFDTEFIVFPQRPLGTYAIRSQKETDPFNYNLAGVDAQVFGNMYSWYRNNQFIKATTTDTLLISKTQKSDTGTYHAIITNNDPRLQGVSLRSAGVLLLLTPCLDLSSFQYDLPEIHCNEYYTLNIHENSIGIGNAPFRYTLNNTLTNQVINANTKSISGIAEGIYTMTVMDSNGCEMKWNENTIVASRPADCDASFSPNGDGMSDAYFIEVKGHANIYDSQGRLIKDLNTPALWEGETNNGELASAGYYIVVINNVQKRSVTLIR